MSEFRRRILTAALTADGGSWYRICPGGIYTNTEGAYINSKATGFNSKRYEIISEVKILVGGYDYQRAYLGSSDKRSYYIAQSFNQISHPRGLNETYVCGILNDTGSRSLMTYKPFIGKRVKFVWPKVSSNEKPYIQFYENGIYGEKLHATSQYSDGNYTVGNPFYIFAYNFGGSIGTDGHNAQDIALYKVIFRNNDIDIRRFISVQLTKNITAELAWDNKIHYAGEYGMYDEVTGKFFGNANSTGYFIENID